MFSRHGGGALDVLGAGVRSVAARLRYADVDACGHADVVGPRREVPVRVVLAAAALQLLVRCVERLSDRLVRPVQRHRSRHRVQRLPPYVHTVFQQRETPNSWPYHVLSRLAKKLVVTRWLYPAITPGMLDDQFGVRPTGSTKNFTAKFFSKFAAKYIY